MRTLELIDYLTEVARRVGYEVREEWMEGSGSGACQINGRKVLFVDQSISPSDRVLQIAEALRGCEQLATIYVLPEARA